MSGSSPQFQAMLMEDLAARIGRGDAAALGELAQHLLPVLMRRLRRAYGRVPSDLLSDACEDAILEYGASPRRFDPARGVPLDRFLQMAAARNLADLLKADARRRRRETTYVERQQSAPRVRTLLGVEGETDARRRILSVVHGGLERTALAQWLAGEQRGRLEFQPALGFDTATTCAQRTARVNGSPNCGRQRRWLNSKQCRSTASQQRSTALTRGTGRWSLMALSWCVRSPKPHSI